MNKKSYRIRKAIRVRSKIKESGAIRLIAYRTSRHMYAQIVTSNGSEVLASASTLEKSIAKTLNYNTSNKNAVVLIGRIIAERALKKGIQSLSFDRSGFKYHGRIKILAESARKFGLKF